MHTRRSLLGDGFASMAFFPCRDLEYSKAGRRDNLLARHPAATRLQTHRRFRAICGTEIGQPGCGNLNPLLQ